MPPGGAGMDGGSPPCVHKSKQLITILILFIYFSLIVVIIISFHRSGGSPEMSWRV